MVDNDYIGIATDYMERYNARLQELKLGFPSIGEKRETLSVFTCMQDDLKAMFTETTPTVKVTEFMFDLNDSIERLSREIRDSVTKEISVGTAQKNQEEVNSPLTAPVTPTEILHKPEREAQPIRPEVKPIPRKRRGTVPPPSQPSLFGDTVPELDMNIRSSQSNSNTTVSSRPPVPRFTNHSTPTVSPIPNEGINDYGEKIAGARKFEMKEFAKTFASITDADILQKPLSKIIEKIDYAKLARKGEISEEDARVLNSYYSALMSLSKPKATTYRGRKQMPEYISQVKEQLNNIRIYSAASSSQRKEISRELAKGLSRESVFYYLFTELGYPTTTLPRLKADEITSRSSSQQSASCIYNAHRFDSAEAAKEEALRINKVRLGFSDIIYSRRDFKVLEYRRNVPGTETGNMAYRYGIAVADPDTQKRSKIEGVPEFATPDEAFNYIEENIDSLSEKANEIISTLHTNKTSSKPGDKLNICIGYDKTTDTFDVYLPMKSFFVFGGMAGDFLPLADGFKNYEDARNWREAHRAAIAERLSEIKDIKTNGSRFMPAEPRIGPDHRHGRDIDERDFAEEFGFRGVQFGNWTNNEDRQRALNESFDAFCDLAEVLNIDHESLSLGGNLAIAFGARGHGGANAHYEPFEKVINLTKTAGAGSLAHEWWHALDNYLGGGKSQINKWASEGDEIGFAEDSALPQRLKDLMISINSSHYSSRNADSDYWGNNKELTARAFAEYVKRELARSGRKNSFLSSPIPSEESIQERNYRFFSSLCDKNIIKPRWANFEEFRNFPESLMGYRYPSSEELAAFSEKFNRFWDGLDPIVDELYTANPLKEARILYSHMHELIQDKDPDQLKVLTFTFASMPTDRFYVYDHDALKIGGEHKLRTIRADDGEHTFYMMDAHELENCRQAINSQLLATKSGNIYQDICVMSLEETNLREQNKHERTAHRSI